MPSWRDLPEHGDAREGDVTDLHTETRDLGNEDVDARPEGDESHAVALIHVLALPGVRHDAARNQARDLSHEDSARAALETDRGLLIGEARLVGSRVHELARRVLDEPHDTAHGISIDVHVED